jgi:outer membrane protein assembly factor BamD (BamD/ComL family)
MGFYQEYELLGLVHDGPTKTLRAREIASDRAVFLHLLTGALAPNAQRSLLEQVDGLIGQSAVLKIGEFAGTRYVVTDILEPFTSLEQWVKERLGASAGPAGVTKERFDAGAKVPGDAAQEWARSVAEPAAPPTADGSSRTPDRALDSGPIRAGSPSPNLAQPTMNDAGPQAEAQDTGERTAQTPRAQRPTDLADSEHDTPASSAGSQALPNAPPASTALADVPSHDGTNRGEGGVSANGAPSPATGAENVPPDQALRELTESLGRPAPESGEAEEEIQAQLDQARQQIEDDTVRTALDSLETALELRPNHPEPSRLAGEPERLEPGRPANEELTAQKEWYYQKAREHWEEGDLEATLDELDRLLALEEDRPSESGRGRTYREFQRQVRAESEALSNSYAEARAQMAEEDLEAALAICDRYLAKFPNHALFQALRFDIGERRRQEALAFIADTDRRVDAEPDLERRIQMLQQALQRYPGEKHFQESIRLIREKQQLVRTVVERANSLEQSQRFREALDQWQLMESVHAQLPGLHGNIKRLEQRIQEHRVRQEARGRWISQSKRCLQAGDYEQALKLVRNALEECPDDAELRQLELEAGQGLQRVDTVRDHLRQAQQLWHAGRRAEGLERLRQAYQIDPRNALVRGELVNALIELARHQVDTDWASAQPLVEEILRLEPNHTVAVHLLEQVGRQRREEMVSWCLVEARRLRSTGETEAAYRLVSDNLRNYPEEDRLLQLEAALAQELDPSLVSASRDEQSLAEEGVGYGGDAAGAGVNAAEDQPGGWAQDAEGYGADACLEQNAYTESYDDAESAGQAEGGLAAETYEDAADGDAELYPESDEELAEDYAASEDDAFYGGGPYAPNEAEIALEAAMPQFAGEGDSPEGAPGARDQQFVHQANMETDEDLLSRLASDSVATAKPGKPLPKQASSKAAKTSALAALKQKCAAAIEELRRRLPAKDFQAIGRTWPVMPTLLGVAAAVALLGILGTVLIWKLTSQGPATPLAAGLQVTIQSSPPGATLIVDGEVCGVSTCQLELAAQSHRVEASLAGFRGAVVSFDLNEANAGQPFVVTLLPLAPVIQLSSDLTSGEVTLDGDRIGELEDGGFEWESELGPGEHTLQVSAAGSSAAISFEIPAGGAPRFTAPPKVNSLKGLMIASLAGVAHVYGTEAGEAVSLDGQPAGKLGTEALVLDGLSEGTHELTLGSGRQQRKYVLESGASPLLAAYLSSDRNVGTLRVITGEDDVKIFLNGTAYRYKTSRGRRLIYLTPKQYEVRVEKEGFRTPAVQTVEIAKGEEVRLEFEMPPLPTTATLRIANGVPGTEVWIDGQSRGVIRSGAFTASLEAGKHAIRLENENYKTTEVEREFGPGATVDLDGTLESAVGTLEIQVNPPTADVSLTLQRDGESTPRPIAEKTQQLSPGTYTVQASAPGFHDYAATIRIAINQTKTASLILRKVEEPKRDQPAVTMSDWEKSGWTREGKLLVRHGGNFQIAAGSGGAGRYTFTALLQKGRRLEWVVNYTGEDNHILYQLGKDFLHRTEVSKGRKSRTIKIPHNMKWGDFLSVDIAVEGESIVHRLLTDGKWVELDNWRQPSSNLAAGKFGFHIPGRDQIGLSHFAFVPQR